MVEGLLLINKPPGVTSHDVVQVVRRKLGVQRVGHTGTLDPMAQGLLILLVGRATKDQQRLQAHEKTYEAVLRLGTQTDTGDAMGKPIRTAPVPPLDQNRITRVLASLKGPLAQRPPSYSAVKVKGRPAHWWARRHQPVTLPERLVHLSEVTLLQCTPETLTFRVHCSAGTYVRALAESIAEQLGTLGHLTSLVRLRVGDWRIEDARPLSWVEASSPDALVHVLQPLCPPNASSKG
ncbi:MAG: tRNA pseudouridine(55) synthase TruB [Candidatus Omnitrophica bacterium]|nr:tRNA pseudouridine(55) synthase TruB [Candidatus Omnitrophota bacterium]